MRHPYTAGKAAQVAIVPVVLGNGTTVQAKLDTGAELCCIKQSTIHLLPFEAARLIDKRELSGLTGPALFDIYLMPLQIAGRTFEVEVAAGPRNIIGMNLLNEILSTFDGPDGHVELTL